MKTILFLIIIYSLADTRETRNPAFYGDICLDDDPRIKDTSAVASTKEEVSNDEIELEECDISELMTETGKNEYYKVQ
jgi:hypothetical protein